MVIEKDKIKKNLIFTKNSVIVKVEQIENKGEWPVGAEGRDVV